MKLMLVRDRNVLNTNWLVYLANLFVEQGHEVVIACDTYSKLGVSGVGYDINPKVKICNLNGKTKNAVINVYRFIRGKILPLTCHRFMSLNYISPLTPHTSKWCNDTILSQKN